MVDSVFSPSFGNRPSQLVGRDSVLDALTSGLASKPGSKERATVLLGQRGSGKTVLLWELADRARDMGFVVASPTVVSEAMLDRIIEKVQEDGGRFIKRSRGKIVGGSIGALGFSAGLQFSNPADESKSFGYKLLKLARALGESGHGLLILVDELQANSPELKQLLVSYAELVGEQQDVAIALAGLPGSVSSVLNDKVLTFLNRAEKVSLEPLDLADVDAYYAQAFETTGLNIAADLRKEAAWATQGSPYLLQLVGHNLVRYSAGRPVTREVLESAVAASQEAFEQDVCLTTMMALSDRDADFLVAMSADDGPSKMADISQRMGVTQDYAQKYRLRLIHGGIVSAPRRGYVEFAVPYLRDYLRTR